LTSARHHVRLFVPLTVGPSVRLSGVDHWWPPHHHTSTAA